eukprot:NODE_605_length_2059_cov_27.359701_g559_i0.p1 GENE.NODE_605_length_2059_cov_27.359701_g559_i0~~NODE_605_length_2059_cov_27.359701_g559_i0.p1  ORF type:complete len:581 (+),score=109.82 NODE_605_length_2059_cov_27.359701_g559_i0:121-1863(+)
MRKPVSKGKRHRQESATHAELEQSEQLPQAEAAVTLETSIATVDDPSAEAPVKKRKLNSKMKKRKPVDSIALDNLGRPNGGAAPGEHAADPQEGPGAMKKQEAYAPWDWKNPETLARTLYISCASLVLARNDLRKFYEPFVGQGRITGVFPKLNKGQNTGKWYIRFATPEECQIASAACPPLTGKTWVSAICSELQPIPRNCQMELQGLTSSVTAETIREYYPKATKLSFIVSRGDFTGAACVSFANQRDAEEALAMELPPFNGLSWSSKPILKQLHLQVIFSGFSKSITKREIVEHYSSVLNDPKAVSHIHFQVEKGLFLGQATVTFATKKLAEAATLAEVPSFTGPSWEIHWAGVGVHRLVRGLEENLPNTITRAELAQKHPAVAVRFVVKDGKFQNAAVGIKPVHKTKASRPQDRPALPENELRILDVHPETTREEVLAFYSARLGCDALAEVTTLKDGGGFCVVFKTSALAAAAHTMDVPPLYGNSWSTCQAKRSVLPRLCQVRLLVDPVIRKQHIIDHYQWLGEDAVRDISFFIRDGKFTGDVRITFASNTQACAAVEREANSHGCRWHLKPLYE